MSLHLTIDPEFASIIPPLREEEQKQLEENTMSRSHARNVNTASLITLCPVCLHSFQDAKKAFLRRADVHQQIKDVCTYCQTRYGFDYYVQPAAAHRDSTRRKVRTYVPASSH